MKIETKFNENDIVFFLMKNKISKGVVRKIATLNGFKIQEIEYHIKHDDHQELLILKEEIVFKTKDELIAFLLKESE